MSGDITRSERDDAMAWSGKCVWCASPLKYKGIGARPLYCGPKCKQKRKNERWRYRQALNRRWEERLR